MADTNYKIQWGEVGHHMYETGVEQGVLYVQDSNGAYPTGVAWDGLSGVTEKPTGADTTKLYADDTVYLNLIAAETFEATIEAYMYPDEFAVCDGSVEVAPGAKIGQQNRRAFGMSYKTIVGNDVDGNDKGYKLHLIYGLTASPSERAYKTINDSPEAISFSWDAKSTPVNVPGYKKTSIITLDSTKVDATKLAQIEQILYGTAATTGENPTPAVDARLPLPEEILGILAGNANNTAG